MTKLDLGDGLYHWPGFCSPQEVKLLIDTATAICTEAPLRQPSMPSGVPLSVQVTNAGPLGWWSDAPKGYRYVEKHPTTGRPWPAIPPAMLALCDAALTGVGLPTMRIDSMLINYYKESANLGLHVDRSEDDQEAPIVSFSVGADAIFMMGGPDRRDKTKEIVLSTGDLLVQGGESRRYFHGIKKLLPTLTSPLKAGRLNFTFRKVRR